MLLSLIGFGDNHDQNYGQSQSEDDLKSLSATLTSLFIHIIAWEVQTMC